MQLNTKTRNPGLNRGPLDLQSKLFQLSRDCHFLGKLWSTFCPAIKQQFPISCQPISKKSSYLSASIMIVITVHHPYNRLRHVVQIWTWGKSVPSDRMKLVRVLHGDFSECLKVPVPDRFDNLFNPRLDNVVGSVLQEGGCLDTQLHAGCRAYFLTGIIYYQNQNSHLGPMRSGDDLGCYRVQTVFRRACMPLDLI